MREVKFQSFLSFLFLLLILPMTLSAFGEIRWEWVSSTIFKIQKQHTTWKTQSSKVKKGKKKKNSWKHTSIELKLTRFFSSFHIYEKKQKLMEQERLQELPVPYITTCFIMSSSTTSIHYISKFFKHFLFGEYPSRWAQECASSNGRRPDSTLLVIKIKLSCIKKFVEKSVRNKLRHSLNSFRRGRWLRQWRWRWAFGDIHLIKKKETKVLKMREL